MRYASGLAPHDDFVLLVCHTDPVTKADNIITRGTEGEVKRAARLAARQIELKPEPWGGTVHTAHGTVLPEITRWLTDLYIENPDGTHQCPTADCCADDYGWMGAS